MEVKIRQDQHGQKIYKILWPNTQLEFHLVDRNSINYDKEAVYILMDKFRRCFYIGEAGPTKSGGVSNRLQTHRWEKEFWDCALIISDSHGDFKQEDIRKWFEWKLNEIAKAANTAVVLSTAGVQNEPYGMLDLLDAVLSVCRLIGISWAFQIEAPQESVPPPKKLVKPNKSVKSVKAKAQKTATANNQPEHWNGKTQLAKLIARRGGNEGAFGGILQFFSEEGAKARRHCHPGSKWRKLLEDAGIKFDKDDFVIDWKNAKNPL